MRLAGNPMPLESSLSPEQASAPSGMVSIVVPCFKESENIPLLVERLGHVLQGRDWEVIFVDDDSPDGSAQVLRELAQQNKRVRFLSRIGRRGLSSACVEGMASSAAPYLLVMDADLQHDETIIPQMLDRLAEDPALDLVVGTRYAAGGGTGEWSAIRRFASRFATLLEKMVLRTPLSDPMSGFFLMRREVFDQTVHQLSAKGFKILLDLVLSSPRKLRLAEVPYTFRTRQHGESKLDAVVALEYLMLLLDKLVGRIIPVGFLIYTFVGATGVLLHLGMLAIFFEGLGWSFGPAQTGATVAAMISNFIFNNQLTFRSSRLRGPALLPGMGLYLLVCGIGAVCNVQLASYLFQHDVPWWVAGPVGGLVSAVWNYTVSAHLIWTWLQNQFARRR